MLVSAGTAFGQQSNNLTVTCDGNFSALQTICKDGNNCNSLNLSNPPVSSASPLDNVFFNPSNTPVNVTWEVFNPNTTGNDDPVSYSIDGIGTFSLNEGVTDVKTQTASSPPPTSISVNHTGQIGNGAFGVVRYRVKCTPVPGKLTINKVSKGGTDTFNVTATPASGPATIVSISTSGAPDGTGSVSVNVAPGAYTISEPTLPAGWVRDSIVCGNSQGQTATATVTANQTTVCTVTNVKQVAGKGNIIINKTAVGGDGTFNFTGTLPAFAITAFSGTGSKTFANQDPGTYTVTEQPTAGFNFPPALNCSTGGSAATPTATIVLVAGATVTCTFTNTKTVASLSLSKTPTPATFTDVGQLITYAIVVSNTGNAPLTEVKVADPGAGLVLGSCSPALPATLAPGASSTCTATHTVTIADVTNVCFNNTATASGFNGQTPVTAQATAQVCLTPDKTKETIRNFLNRRVDLLASNEPDRARMQRRFDRPQQPAGSLKDEPPMKLSGSAENGRSEFSFATSLSQIAQSHAAASHAKMAAARPDGQMNLGAAGDGRTPVIPAYPQVPGVDVWVEGHFQKWDDDLGTSDNSGRFGILYVGADYLVSPWILVGALVQFDWMDDESKKLNTDVSGNGWLAGPYVTLKLSDNIMFDARGAWGQSDNDISPFGTYTDSFDTDRWLAKANLTGNWYAGALRISPSVGVIYVEETQHAYVDSLGFTIDSQSVHIGRLTFGPEFGYAIQSSDGTIIEPHVSFTGMWDFDKDSTATVGGLTTSRDDFRVKVEGGLMVRATDGLSARATVSYDGIGSDDLNAWGGQLWLSVPLN